MANNEHLTPQESIRIIEQMLRDSRERLVNKVELPLLIYGYVTLFVSLLIYFTLPHIGMKSMYLWFLIPIIGNPLLFFLKRKEARSYHVRTQTDYISTVVWNILGINVLLLSISTFIVYTPILSLVLIIIGMATAIMAFILKINILKVSSIFGMVAGYVLLLIPMNTRVCILCFGIAFFLMHCLPGHYLSIKNKKTAHRATHS